MLLAKSHTERPKSVHQDHQALNIKFKKAKVSNLNLKFCSAKLLIGSDTFYVNRSPRASSNPHCPAAYLDTQLLITRLNTIHTLFRNVSGFFLLHAKRHNLLIELLNYNLFCFVEIWMLDDSLFLQLPDFVCYFSPASFMSDHLSESIVSLAKGSQLQFGSVTISANLIARFSKINDYKLCLLGAYRFPTEQN